MISRLSSARTERGQVRGARRRSGEERAGAAPLSERRRGGCWGAQARRARGGPTPCPGQGPSGRPSARSAAHQIPRGPGSGSPSGILKGLGEGGSTCVFLCLPRSRKSRGRRGFLPATPGAPDAERPVLAPPGGGGGWLGGRRAGAGAARPPPTGPAPRAAAPAEVKAATSLRREPGCFPRPAPPGGPEPGVVCHFEEKKKIKTVKTIKQKSLPSRSPG